AAEPLTVGGTVYDQYGNPVPGQAVDLAATYQGSPAGSFTPGPVTTDASGDFSATYTPPGVAENVDLTATSGGAASPVLTLDVLGATPADMSLAVTPSSGTAGEATNLTINASLTDGTAAQNLVGDWPLTLTITPPSGSPSTYHATTGASTGLYAWSLPFPTLAGTYQVEATADGTGLSRTGSFAVQPAGAAKVTITGPAAVPAGSPFPLSGSVYDPYGNLVTESPVTVSLQFGASTATAQTANGSYSYSGFVAPLASGGTFTFTAEVGGYQATTTIQVVAGAPAYVKLAPLGPLTAGETGAVLQGTITDQYGNLVTGQDSVSLAATDGTFAASGLATATVTAQDGKFQATYQGPDTAPETVTLTAGEGNLTPQAESVSIVPAAPKALTLTVPNSLRAGEDYTVGGTLKDGFGNPIAGASVTMSLQAPGDGSFGGNVSTTVTTDPSGSYSATLTASQTSGAYDLTATAGGLTESTSLNVTGATPENMTPLELTYQKPATAGTGTLQAQTTVTDTFGNAVGGWQVDLLVKTADGKTATITTPTGTAGIATFSLPMPTWAGPLTLTATPENTKGLSQTDDSIDIAPAAPKSMTLVSQGGSAVAAGGSYTVEGAVYDTYGNVEAGASLAVSVSDGTTTEDISTTSGTYEATFTAPTKAGTGITLTASVLSVSATPLALTVVPAAAAAIALQSPPATMTAGGQVTLQGAIEDRYQNLVSGTASVTLTASDGSFASGQKTMTVTATNGSFSAGYTAPGAAPETVTLMAESGSLPPYTAKVQINGAAAASFSVEIPSLIRDGGSYTVSGMVYDQYGDGTSAPVTLTLQTGGGTFQNGKGSIQVTSGGDGAFAVTYSAPSGIGSEGGYTLTVDAALLAPQSYTLDVTGGTPATMEPLTITYDPSPSQPTAGDGKLIVHTVLYDQDQNAVGSWPLTITLTDQKGDVTTYHTLTGGFTSGAINFQIPMPTVAGAAGIVVLADSTSISQSQTIDIEPAAPASLTLAGTPGSGDLAAGGAVQVGGTVYDTYGNHVLAGVSVTLTSAAFPGGPVTVQTDPSGAYSYRFIALTKAGTAFTVAASVAGAAAPPALSYTVVAASPYSFTLTGPAAAPAGSEVTVGGAVYDQYGNPEPQGIDVQLSLGGTPVATVQTDPSGAYSYQFTAPTKAGTVVEVQGSVSGVGPGQTPAALEITVIHSVAANISFTLPKTVQAGSATSVVGYVDDQYGNPVGGQSVTFATNLGTLAAGGQSGASVTISSGTDGSLPFTLNAPTAVSITPGTITVTAETAVGKTTIEGSWSTALVAADPATITLDAPAAATVGASIKVSGYVHDAYQNPVP
ncbi:MAG: carboxypeptidase regulatory-like domain-containing protein, partial [Actinomycetota bacterium]|nr:carboxypeptidase regulatory-like domain-containing protein [Actinomycetota bacterium]